MNLTIPFVRLPILYKEVVAEETAEQVEDIPSAVRPQPPESGASRPKERERQKELRYQIAKDFL